ncbi:MAG: CHRD domain-containing protein [Acidobacteriota bacterium]|nr:CHRD domain-containing protein [Acidobacteriota bacterium]
MIKRNYLTSSFLTSLFASVRLFAPVAFAFCFLGAAEANADTVFTASLNNNQVVPPTNSTASGAGSVILNQTENLVTVTLNLNGLQNAQVGRRIHGPAPRGANAGSIIIMSGGVATQTFHVSQSQAADLKAGLWYFSVTSPAFPDGEIRGQIEPLCAPPPVNLTAWYRAENNVYDSTGSYNGIAPNGVGYAAGIVGKAFNFNGTNQYADLGKFFDYKTFTISMWVKPGETQLAYANLADNNRTATTNWGIEQNNTSTNHYYYIDKGGRASFTLQPNVWQHLTVTRGENFILIYINGVFFNSSTTTATVSYDSARTLLLARYFNRSNQTTNRFWNGQIDEFTTFNRVLSESEIKNLYNSGAGGMCPDSTPLTERLNGKIIFTRTGELTYQLYTIGNNGGDLRKISPNPNFSDQQAAFSPDGSKIAFVRNTNIYVMNADGSNPVDLYPASPTNESFPRWSPDGRKISFIFGSGDQSEIYVMNSDGSNPIRLTNNSFYDYGATWSPDGRKILFSSNRPGNYEIYTMNTDGSNPVRLTNNPAHDNSPSWSPDGKYITFFSNRVGTFDIYRMKADGSDLTNLTNTPSIGEQSPTMSPDGTKIVFLRNQSNSFQIWTMNAGGGGEALLVGDGLNYSPTWEPILKTQYTNISLANGINVTFSNVGANGETVATMLQSKQFPPLPPNYFPGSPVYDIRTSVPYAGYVTVSFSIASVPDSAACSEMRLLHYTNGGWTDFNNWSPVYNSGICTISQGVSTLSPFMAARVNDSPTTISLSGTVTYGITENGQSVKTVPNVSITAVGDSFAVFNTNMDGAYLLDNLIDYGRYLVTPVKTGNENGISAFDATLVLRFVAAGGNGNLTPNQRFAADANNDGTVTAFDATQILRYVAAAVKSNATGEVGNWRFTPPSRSYSPLVDSLERENYEAILIGEVSGDWMPSQNISQADSDQKTISSETVNSTSVLSINSTANRSEKDGVETEILISQDEISSGTNAQLLPGTKTARMDKGILIIPVLLTNTSQSVADFSFEVKYDSDVLAPDHLKPFETNGTLSENGFSVVADTKTQDRIGIAAASGTALITENGRLINLRFKVIDPKKIGSDKTTLTLSRLLLENCN